MPKNIAETTQLALVQLTVQQMKETMLGMASDIKEIRNNRYVTQNDMQLAIKGNQEEFFNKIKTLSDKIDYQTKIGTWIIGLVIVAVVGALMKTILKV